MEAKNIRQEFEDNFDCYAVTGDVIGDDHFREGDIVSAMTKEKFIETVSRILLKQLEEVSDYLPANIYTRSVINIEKMYNGDITNPKQ